MTLTSNDLTLDGGGTPLEPGRAFDHDQRHILRGIVTPAGVFTLNARAGSRVPEVRLNSRFIGHAQRLAWRNGSLYALSDDGRWLLWRAINGGHGSWERTPRGPRPDEPPEAVCVVCGEPEAKIIDGKSYCGDHHPGSSSASAALPCVECGAPATRVMYGKALCASHTAAH